MPFIRCAACIEVVNSIREKLARMFISVSVQSVVMLPLLLLMIHIIYTVYLYSHAIWNIFSFLFWLLIWLISIYGISFPKFRIFPDTDCVVDFKLTFMHSEDALCMVEIFMFFEIYFMTQNIFHSDKYLISTWRECDPPVVGECAIFDFWWGER